MQYVCLSLSYVCYCMPCLVLCLVSSCQTRLLTLTMYVLVLCMCACVCLVVLPCLVCVTLCATCVLVLVCVAMLMLASVCMSVTVMIVCVVMCACVLCVMLIPCSDMVTCTTSLTSITFFVCTVTCVTGLHSATLIMFAFLFPSMCVVCSPMWVVLSTCVGGKREHVPNVVTCSLLISVLYHRWKIHCHQCCNIVL